MIRLDIVNVKNDDRAVFDQVYVNGDTIPVQEGDLIRLRETDLSGVRMWISGDDLIILLNTDEYFIFENYVALQNAGTPPAFVDQSGNPVRTVQQLMDTLFTSDRDNDSPSQQGLLTTEEANNLLRPENTELGTPEKKVEPLVGPSGEIDVGGSTDPIFFVEPVLDLFPVVEQAKEGSHLQYEVRLDQAANFDVVVNYTVTPSGFNGVEPEDFVGGELPSGQVIIPAGRVSAMITLDTVGNDGVPESIEALTLTVSVDEATLGVVTVRTSSLDGKVNDDRTAAGPELSLTPKAPNETGQVHEGGTLAFDVSLSFPVDYDIIVFYGVFQSGTDPAEAEDFVGGFPAGSFVIPAGGTTVELLIPTVDDILVEDLETFVVGIQASSETVGPVSQDAVFSPAAIIDNDTGEPPVISSLPEGFQLSGTDYQGKYVEDGAPAPVFDPNAAPSEFADTPIQLATVTLTNPQDGPDESLTLDPNFSVPVGLKVAVAPDGHSVTISGDAPLSDYEAVFDAIFYRNASQDPADSPARTISFSVTLDGGAVHTADNAISVVPVNDAPFIDLDNENSFGIGFGTGVQVTFVEDGAPIDLTNNTLDISDVDDTEMVQAIVSLQNPLDGELESLSLDPEFAVPLGITVTVSPDGHTVMISGAASLADYTSVLAAVQYDNASENPTTSEDRLVAFAVSDGTDVSNTAISTVNVEANNDLPVIDLDDDDSSGGEAQDFFTTFTENGSAVTVSDSDLSVLSDDAFLTSASVRLTNPGDGLLESLSIDSTLALSFDLTVVGNGTHTISLIGSATAEEYRQVLATVKYNNLSENPSDETVRTVEFNVTDEMGTSPTATAHVTVKPVNDAPDVAADKGITVKEDSGPVALNIEAPTDPDDPLDSLTILVTQVPDAAKGEVLDGLTAVKVGDRLTLTALLALTFVAVVGATGDAGAFAYEVIDPDGASDTQTVALRIESVDAVPPLAVDDMVMTTGPVALDVLANDIFEDPLQSLTLGRVSGGTAEVQRDNTVLFTPAEGFEGLAGFTYTITEQDGENATANAGVAVFQDGEFGTEGDDTLSGTSADDVLFGEGGNDTLTGDAGNDALDGGDGDDSVHGNSGDDLLVGGRGDDDLRGDSGIDRLFGGLGNDQLYGGSEGDHLFGGAGNDALFGDSGDDVLRGGPGDDALDGGSGSDTFVYSIVDFFSGTDTISNFDPDDPFEDFDFSGLFVDAPFDFGDPGLFLKVFESGENTVIQADPSGTGTFKSDLVILEGVTGLSLDTFVGDHVII